MVLFLVFKGKTLRVTVFFLVFVINKNFRMRRLSSTSSFSWNWFDDLLDLLLGRHDCYGSQRKIRRNVSENLSWRFSWYFKWFCVHAEWTSAHKSKMDMEWLKDRFPEKKFSLKSEFIWPPRSPDLNPLHFYLWGCMKD